MKRGKPLQRMSAKRRAAHAKRVRPGHGIPLECELCLLLWDVKSNTHNALPGVEPHHGWSRRLDDPCNVVTVCRSCHLWCHKHPKENRLVVAWALVDAGRFDRERIRAAWGKDPIAFIEIDYQSGAFRSDAVLDEMAAVLLNRF